MDQQQNTPESYTDVLIGGKVYRLHGADPDYLHRIATLLNKKIADVKKLPGYPALDQSYKELMLNINIADEYLTALALSDRLKDELKDRENELYTARNELVGMKMKLENVLKQADLLEKRLNDLKTRYHITSDD